MKILYITSFFDIKGSSAAVRNVALVNGLIQKGHKVDVLTLKFPDEKYSPFFQQVSCHSIIRVDLGITSVIKNSSKSLARVNNSIFRPLKNFLRDIVFFPDVYYKWSTAIDVEQFSGYDIIISSSDTKSSHYPAYKIKKRYPNIRWIQIWGDPWSLDSNLNAIIRIRAKRQEHFLLLKADKVVYVSELTCKAITKLYPNFRDKLFYVPRSFFCPIECNRKEGEKTYNIVYSGSLNVQRQCVFFLDDVQNYNSRNEMKFTVSFYGDYLDEIRLQLQKYDFVSIYPTVDYGQMLDVFKQTDALLFISNKKGSTQIPGKLFDYMGTNLPVICLLDKQDENLMGFLNRYSKCLIYSENFVELVENGLLKKYSIIEEFSPGLIADKILS